MADTGDWSFEDDSELVILTHAASEEELVVLRGLLESAGIECFCPEFYSRGHRRMAEGIPLRVKRGDLEDARALLASGSGGENEDGEP